MREIKFRGKIHKDFDIKTFNLKNKLNKKIDDFVYGSLVIGLDNKYWIWFNLNNRLVCVLVNHETVGQYIGLKDKFEQDIYEDDIIRFKALREKREGQIFLCIIEYTNYTGMNGFIVRGQDRRFFCLINENLIYNHNIEVIGNKYDNKELLKKYK